MVPEEPNNHEEENQPMIEDRAEVNETHEAEEIL